MHVNRTAMCCRSLQVLYISRRSLETVTRKSVYNFGTMATSLDKITDVDIDANGIFKYILVHVHDDVNKQSKPIVRGYAKCTWHADIYDEIANEIKPLGPGLDTECVGGGRINHDATAKSINVYGYSQGFGKADHRISVDLLKKKYPDYVITWSDEGY
ncbi:14 kDa phosphohistidine phosphatase-like [Venturia canescens]|uniref:14 kDa phosphohistidine phosphatase-like n=1 Tax=Venturia canescens TaxID=32260 RepID=UPI001C9C44C1|nr:14 kDa phosphohistidine phosphatase-like [Venturia canescens]